MADLKLTIELGPELATTSGIRICRLYHRIGQQPTLPAAGTNRRVTIYGSVEFLGRGRVEVFCVSQDSATFLLYLAALDERHKAIGRAIALVLDHGSCHTSEVSTAALAERESWLHVIWFPKYSPNLNRTERHHRIVLRHPGMRATGSTELPDAC